MYQTSQRRYKGLPTNHCDELHYLTKSNYIPIFLCRRKKHNFHAEKRLLSWVISENEQWRNSRGVGRWGWGQSASLTLLTGKFLLTYQEKRWKEKRANGEEEKENQKREGGKLKMEGGKVTKWKNCFVFLFLFFGFSLFKTTEIYFGLPKWEFSSGKKKKFHAGKKFRKNYFVLLWKIFLLCPWKWGTFWRSRCAFSVLFVTEDSCCAT